MVGGCWQLDLNTLHVQVKRRRNVDECWRQVLRWVRLFCAIRAHQSRLVIHARKQQKVQSMPHKFQCMPAEY